MTQVFGEQRAANVAVREASRRVVTERWPGIAVFVAFGIHTRTVQPGSPGFVTVCQEEIGQRIHHTRVEFASCLAQIVGACLARPGCILCEIIKRSNAAPNETQALRAGNHPPAYPDGADIGQLHASEMSPSLNSITSYWFCLYDAMERLVGTEAWEIAEHLAVYLKSLPESDSETESVGGNGNYILTTQQLDDIVTFATGLSSAGLGYADIIYWSETAVPHVAFVVGWGPRAVGGTTIDSWDAWNNLAEKPTPVADYQSGYVPYMVDNGREDVGDVVNPIPYYLMRLAPVSFFGPVEFIKVPDVVFVDPGGYVTPVF